MLKTTLARIRTHLVLTVASAMCMIVAVIALGYTVYNGLCLVVIPVAASALTALIFFALAAGALLVLQIEPKRPEPEEPTGVAGVLAAIDWGRFAPLLGQISLAVSAVLAERARARHESKDRGRDRGKR
jgi:hypothetical protein